MSNYFEVIGLFRFFSLVCVFAVSAIPSHANLGDTLGQCIVRYGKPIEPHPNLKQGEGYTFRNHGYEIDVMFWKDTVGAETFTKKDRSPLTDQEKEAILRADLKGLNWTKQPNMGNNERWIRTDGAQAFYLFEGSLMNMETKAFSESTDY